MRELNLSNVLPTVYNDTLSFGELLSKLTYYIEEFGKDLDADEDRIKSLEATISALVGGAVVTKVNEQIPDDNGYVTIDPEDIDLAFTGLTRAYSGDLQDFLSDVNKTIHLYIDRVNQLPTTATEVTYADYDFQGGMKVSDTVCDMDGNLGYISYLDEDSQVVKITGYGKKLMSSSLAAINTSLTNINSTLTTIQAYKTFYFANDTISTTAGESKSVLKSNIYGNNVKTNDYLVFSNGYLGKITTISDSSVIVDAVGYGLNNLTGSGSNTFVCNVAIDHEQGNNTNVARSNLFPGSSLQTVGLNDLVIDNDGYAGYVLSISGSTVTIKCSGYRINSDVSSLTANVTTLMGQHPISLYIGSILDGTYGRQVTLQFGAALPYGLRVNDVVIDTNGYVAVVASVDDQGVTVTEQGVQIPNAYAATKTKADSAKATCDRLTGSCMVWLYQGAISEDQVITYANAGFHPQEDDIVIGTNGKYGIAGDDNDTDFTVSGVSDLFVAATDHRPTTYWIGCASTSVFDASASGNLTFAYTDVGKIYAPCGDAPSMWATGRVGDTFIIKDASSNKGCFRVLSSSGTGTSKTYTLTKYQTFDF